MISSAPKKHAEDRLQQLCRVWFDIQHPAIAPLLHHSPNEGILVNSRAGGAKRKAMGVRAGFPDFILLVPNRRYHYMAIELKTPTGRQSRSQQVYESLVVNAGGAYVVVRTLDDFINEVQSYLKER